jgi:hypothetical protein
MSMGHALAPSWVPVRPDVAGPHLLAAQQPHLRAQPCHYQVKNP